MKAVKITKLSAVRGTNVVHIQTIFIRLACMI